MVDTIKFSEFIDGGDLEPNQITVGLDNTLTINTRFTNAFPLLPPGPTSSRPAIAPSMYYRLRFNTSSLAYEYYEPLSATWVELSSTGSILPLLASHLPLEGASLIGLQDQAGVVSQTVQDLANSHLIATVDDGTLVNGVFLSTLATGFLSSTIVSGVLASRTFLGTTNQINVANGDGSANPVFSLSSTLNAPGTFTIQSTVAISAIINDDTFVTALATNIPTALSVKNYISSVAPVPAALTKVDDTNVTLTLGGTPATALLQAVSLTLGWAGQLDLTRGGTNASLTASNGGIVYSTATAMAILSGTATAGQLLQSGSSAAPSWTTATFPTTAGSAGTILRANGTNWVASTATFADTYAASTLLYSNGVNTVIGLATANSASLVTSSTGVPVWSSTMTNGQLIIGSTGATPTAATLTAGVGISITNAAGSITLAATGGGLSWATLAGTSQAAAVNNGYISGNAAQTTVTLPATAAIGDIVAVEGLGAAGWVLTANTGQTIKIGSSTTSSAGSLTSVAASDNVYVTCIVANTTWRVRTTNSAGLTVT